MVLRKSKGVMTSKERESLKRSRGRESLKRSAGRDGGACISSLVRSGKDVIAGSPKYTEVATSTLNDIDLKNVVVVVKKQSVVERQNRTQDDLIEERHLKKKSKAPSQPESVQLEDCGPAELANARKGARQDPEALQSPPTKTPHSDTSASSSKIDIPFQEEEKDFGPQVKVKTIEFQGSLECEKSLVEQAEQLFSEWQSCMQDRRKQHVDREVINSWKFYKLKILESKISNIERALFASKCDSLHRVHQMQDTMQKQKNAPKTD